MLGLNSVSQLHIATKLLCMHLQPGFYDVSRGCHPCGCNLGGSESTICNQSTVDAQCPCKPNIDSITCTAPLPGYFFRPLDFILFEAEEAELSQVWLLQLSFILIPVNWE